MISAVIRARTGFHPSAPEGRTITAPVRHGCEPLCVKYW